MKDSEISRLINNQRAEYTPHAFHSSGPGMDDFRKLVPYLRKMPACDLKPWLELIDSMAATHAECHSCTSKILVYQLIITEDLFPELCAMYTDEYCKRQLRRSGRDYFNEVIDALGDSVAHTIRADMLQKKIFAYRTAARKCRLQRRRTSGE